MKNKKSQEAIPEFRNLIKWSCENFSNTIWRKRRSLYTTLVSEIMLQQTTVSTVQRFFSQFIKRFPDLKSLALASEDDVKSAWRGLGYYRRASNLHKAAFKIINELDGNFPNEQKDLMKIPGIGTYTANAINAIGRNKNVLAIDVNLERVFSRLFCFKNPKLDCNDHPIIQKVLIKHGGRKFNEAIMDLGRTVCLKKNPKCDQCPLKNSCLSFKKNCINIYPAKIPSISLHSLILLRIIDIKKGKIAVIKKEENQWLHGQYELPTFIIETSDKNLKQYPYWNKKIPTELFTINSRITKYKIRNVIMKSKINRELKKSIEYVSIDNSLLSSLSLKIIQLTPTQLVY